MKAVDLAVDFGCHLYKDHPRMVLFILIMCALTFGVCSIVFAQKSYVEKVGEGIQDQFSVEIAQIKNKVDTLQGNFNNFSNKSDRNFLLIQMGNMEREIYELEELVSDGQANQRNRDRLVEVRSQYKEAERQLNAIPVN